MANVFRVGEGKTFDHTPTNIRSAGQIEELDSTDNFVGVYTENVAANELTAVGVEGVYRFTKATASDTWAVGAAIEITVIALDATVAASATGAHRAAQATANGDTTAEVKINVMRGS